MLAAHALTALILFQSPEASRTGLVEHLPAPRSGIEAGVVETWFDEGLGVKDAPVLGYEAGFRFGGEMRGFDVTYRVMYLQWRPDFDRFEGQNVDLDGEIHALVVDLAVLYPLSDWFRAGLTVGGGAMLFKHDLDREGTPLLEGGPLFRLDLPGPLNLEAGYLLHSHWTEFGEQHFDSDHLSHSLRLSLGLELNF